MMKTIWQTVLISVLTLSVTEPAIAKPMPDSISVKELPTIYNHLLTTQSGVEILDWETVDKLIPKYSTFKIVDVDTGVFFYVQRRSGDSHADVQPLTSSDTKIMKQIYDGKWSWRRKAILVVTENRVIAASMNGMPHGGGALQNNFPGHFCVHFAKSTTHRSNKEAFAHQLMVLKAGGKINDFLSTATSDEVIHTFVAAIQQDDPFILNEVVMSQNGESILNQIVNVQLLNDSFSSYSSPIMIEAPIKVVYKDGNRLQKKKDMLRVERASLTDRWLVNADLLLESLS
mgnify:FL=1